MKLPRVRDPTLGLFGRPEVFSAFCVVAKDLKELLVLLLLLLCCDMWSSVVVKELLRCNP